ncbi:aminotransferase class V-fold PLP-dependent enzyme [Aestuariispira insulae]|uniref:Serine-glyoxylate aminotransferase n=1 Tax=Aestuariispira insulae TaxID=1461337 RepID=A0A3D9H424_9PROT|nr:aminotransferase class V-fold PLP-dependent enzyme [Aestuariispira insulae]RED44254.1 serine-glyoxylate aminotransferase [Aestuariispira insulae]
MAGRNALFIPGPTNIPDHIRSAVDLSMEDMRAPDFPEFTLPLFQDLKKIFKTETGQVFLFPGSGTGGWEAAITNTLSPGDKVLISRFGQFSHLWVDMLERFKLDVDCIDVEWGEGVPVEEFAKRLEADTNKEIKAVFACHNETATGVTSDIAGIRKALDAADHPAMLYVDGVSSIASIDFCMDEWGVDLAVSGSQKGFMLPTGLAIVAVSQKALEARHTAQHTRCFFDFEDMIKTNAQGYFPYTPATTLLRGLRASVDTLLGEGLDNVFARHNRMAEGVRRAVTEGWGLDLCAKEPKWYSDTVSAICVPEGFDSAEVVRHAYYEYNISLGVGLSKVAGKVFRIGHLGSLNETMLLGVLGGVEMTLRDLGIPVEAGSGVAQAVDYYRTTRGQALAAAAE